MKQFFLTAFAAATLVACGETRNDTTVDTDTTTETTTSTSDNAAYSTSEGDVTRRDGKVMIYRNGQWVEANEDVRLENEVVVTRNGRVIKDGRERDLEDGEVVNKTGEFFDRTGRAIENAWDDTKKGIKKAGDKIEDVVDGDGNNR